MRETDCSSAALGGGRTIQTTTLRLLRMNVNSLFENFDLIIRTIDGLDFSDDSRLWGEGSGKNDAVKLARE